MIMPSNGGYCKLQLGDLENAYADLYGAFEMNPDNSFAWRNIGAYYLATCDFAKALEHFEEAQKADPKTRIISFYLGHTHRVLGNTDLSKICLDKSKDLDEYNDSMID